MGRVSQKTTKETEGFWVGVAQHRIVTINEDEDESQFTSALKTLTWI